MLISTMQETSTNTGLKQDMCLHWPKHRCIGALFYNLLSHCLLRRQCGHDRGYEGGNLVSRVA